MRDRSRRRDNRCGFLLAFDPVGAAVAFVAILVGGAPAFAREVTVPLQLDHAFIERILLDTVYTGEGDTAEALSDTRGCNQVVLSTPSVASRDGRLVVRTQTRARLGAWMGRCVTLHNWEGVIEVHEEPHVDPGVPVIRFRVVDSNVEASTGGKGLTGKLWDLVKSGVHPRLEDLVVDLRGPLTELSVALPLFLSQADASRTRLLLNSLTFANPRVIDEGLAVDLRIDLSEIPPPVAAPSRPEPTLTVEELERWEQSWQRWDAFMTFMVLSLSRDPHDEHQIQALRDIFLEARYDLAYALRSNPEAGEDPVRELFVQTWARLRPLLRELSIGLPGETSLRYLSLIAAADALQALDQVGPEVGVEISAEGLRRLARLIDPIGSDDPLAYDTDVNPELRELLGFGEPLELPTPLPRTDVVDELEPSPEEELTPSEASPGEVPTAIEPSPEEEPTELAPSPGEEPTQNEPSPEVQPTAIEPSPEEEPTELAPSPGEEPTQIEPSPEVQPAPLEPSPQEDPTALEPSPEVQPTDIQPSPQAEPTESEMGPEAGPTEPEPSPQASWFDWIIPAAAADEGRDTAAVTRRLRGWAPTRADAAQYLPIALQVLELNRKKVLAKRKLADEYHSLFRTMVLATAWKESCWRQYVRVGGKVKTITSSAGALGVMQINQHVWRGIYDVPSLRDDFSYNAMAGIEILLHYLVDYAIKKGEHTATGNRDNLARASYCVYNGGPGHLRRYRTTKNKQLREIDESFWSKFREIKKGNDLAVRECYG